MNQNESSILHVCSRDTIISLRDQILRLNGYDVVSTMSLEEAPRIFEQRPFGLVLVDVEGQWRVNEAEDLCAELRTLSPKQKIAFVCNYRVSIDSDCPDEIINAEFNPVNFVEGVRQMLE